MHNDMDALDTILDIAVDLTAALTTTDRYQRLLSAVKRVIPFDAATLLRLDGETLTPVAAWGLTEDAMGRQYPLRENPRLEIICRSEVPVLFPSDTTMSDPFDGMLEGDARALTRVHACLGCPLRVEGELLGVLTADALAPNAFDDIDPRFLRALGALAGAAMRTSDLIEVLEKSVEHQGLVARELMRVARQMEGPELIGLSRPITRLREEIELVAKSDFTVLITGETGVGKELVARAVHESSARRDQPMIYVNCSALPESLAESELFGHVRGAFTGASSDRPGKFEVAHGGTLFLDEIGELPPGVQPKLLRALQQGEIQRVGSDKARAVDVRVLAATNRVLSREVERGAFRADLYHRLAVFPINVPPLRDRIEDIPMLAGYFCDAARRRLGIGPVRITPDAVAALRRYSWPGNVRELENVVSRVTLRTSIKVPRGEPVVLEQSSFEPALQESGAPPSAPAPGAAPLPAPGLALRDAIDEFQRNLIARTVKDHGGNWAAAARTLGLHRSNLHHLATRLGLK
ncbi:MAG: nitric oxide reductase transcriptional regulator NorR [Thermoanaerobaculia bacterium]|nr:nitric oxide reductase transcriptional regulator NorR [Thermoanaerobaculia bacterium]